MGQPATGPACPTPRRRRRAERIGAARSFISVLGDRDHRRRQARGGLRCCLLLTPRRVFDRPQHSAGEKSVLGMLLRNDAIADVATVSAELNRTGSWAGSAGSWIGRP